MGEREAVETIVCSVVGFQSNSSCSVGSSEVPSNCYWNFTPDGYIESVTNPEYVLTSARNMYEQRPALDDDLDDGEKVVQRERNGVVLLKHEGGKDKAEVETEDSKVEY